MTDARHRELVRFAQVGWPAGSVVEGEVPDRRSVATAQKGPPAVGTTTEARPLGVSAPLTGVCRRACACLCLRSTSSRGSYVLNSFILSCLSVVGSFVCLSHHGGGFAMSAAGNVPAFPEG